MFPRQLISLFCFAGLLSFSACTTLSNMETNPEDREALLRVQVGSFHRAADRGQMEDALEHVKPNSRELFVEKQESEKNDERVVEKQVEHVDFNADADQATVIVLVRYFKKPTYVVMERKEEEQWEFSLSSGWLWKQAKQIGGAESEHPAMLHGTL